jgi:peptidyl-tRNA hydrolase, PTH1 family
VAQPFLLLGLGNPGPEYARTRHNVGFDAVDAIAEITECRVSRSFFRPLLVGKVQSFAPLFSPLVLAKPLTYMNRSGDVLPWLQRKYRLTPDRICVIVDNMDLPSGEVRMKLKGGPSSHNGLRSVAAVLETTEFPRIYIGIGRPTDGQGIVDHVLGSFSTEESIATARAIRRLAALFHQPPFETVQQLVSAINEKRRSSQ